MAERRETGGREALSAKRLRWIRIAEGVNNLAVWAEKTGISITALSNYENGIPISKAAAIQMADRVPGLTTDYILRGREDLLTFEFRERLRKAQKVVGAPNRRREPNPS
ncbi:MAG: hypothetical protein JWP25_4720 [Bradyrhizobium sp.]|nr:hypothetical protein [Bradyrhizobium sp.]